MRDLKMEPVGPSPIKLSVVIRCRDGAAGLSQAFDALHSQSCDFAWEMIVVATAAVGRPPGARWLPLAPDQFTDGRAANVGIRQARGELVLLMNADTVLIGSGFLDRAVAPFQDPQMAAARCLPVANAAQLTRWNKPHDVQYASAAEQQQAERAAHWSDYPASACCVIRRSVWEQVPFDEYLEASEDKLWASRVLARGFKIRACAEALWLTNNQAAKADQRTRRNLEQLGFYRFTGRRPLTWPAFLVQTLRSLVEAPVIAVRYAVEQIAWNVRLVSIPWQARRGKKNER